MATNKRCGNRSRAALTCRTRARRAHKCPGPGICSGQSQRLPFCGRVLGADVMTREIKLLALELGAHANTQVRFTVAVSTWHFRIAQIVDLVVHVRFDELLPEELECRGQRTIVEVGEHQIELSPCRCIVPLHQHAFMRSTAKAKCSLERNAKCSLEKSGARCP